ncbi:MAG: BON domain-containing protein [Actinobacteria bacterium]|nr:BON domain-containing protein [Actinomycetota bacterium]
MAARDDAVSTDERLRREVEAQLASDACVDARRLVVSVSDGVVTLAGEVGSLADKWEVERAVERMAGIRGIANSIEVHGDRDRADSDIARRAVEALARNVFVPSRALTVRVENGWVVLAGEVSRDFQRRAAERAVRNLPAVRGISSVVTVRPRAARRGDDGSR